MKLLLTLIVTVFLFTAATASAGYVSGHYRSNGTYVSGYYRTEPNSYKFDNYSYRQQSFTRSYTPPRRYTPRTRSFYTPRRSYNW